MIVRLDWVGLYYNFEFEHIGCYFGGNLGRTGVFNIVVYSFFYIFPSHKQISNYIYS